MRTYRDEHGREFVELDAPSRKPQQSPAWFNNTIRRGLQILQACALHDTPGAEQFAIDRPDGKGTTDGPLMVAWIETVWKAVGSIDEQVQRPRLIATFDILRAEEERWPAPATFIRALARVPRADATKFEPIPKDQARALLTKLKFPLEK